MTVIVMANVNLADIGMENTMMKKMDNEKPKAHVEVGVCICPSCGNVHMFVQKKTFPDPKQKPLGKAEERI